MLLGRGPQEGAELLGFFPVFLAPKKNVFVMAPLTRGDGKRRDKQKAPRADFGGLRGCPRTSDAAGLLRRAHTGLLLEVPRVVCI